MEIISKIGIKVFSIMLNIQKCLCRFLSLCTGALQIMYHHYMNEQHLASPSTALSPSCWVVAKMECAKYLWVYLFLQYIELFFSFNNLKVEDHIFSECVDYSVTHNNLLFEGHSETWGSYDVQWWPNQCFIFAAATENGSIQVVICWE